MSRSKQPHPSPGAAFIERGTALYLELVRANPRLAAEFSASAALFFPDERAADAEARRRHLEWFLFERPSAALDGVPCERLAESWRARARSAHGAGDARGEGAECLLASHAGVFEVTGVAAGSGAWLRDLLGLGEYPLDEEPVLQALAVGDLLVGRLFPLGTGQFAASPAACILRSPELGAALKRDLEQLRAGRRGSLRVSQAELERMFFGGQVRHASADRARRRAVAVLVEGGLAGPRAEAAVQSLVDSPWDDGVVLPGAQDQLGELLERLAFETAVDLERARRALLDAWESHARARGPGSSRGSATGATGGSTGGGAAVPPKRGRDDRRARAALEAFDRGRQSGQDLEHLFAELESDLGLEPGSTAIDGDEQGETEHESIELDGLVGALLAEYRWDVGQQQAVASAAELEALRHLERSAHNIGQLADLTPLVLLHCAAHHVLEQRSLHTEGEARALITALAGFARWCDQTQDVALAAAFDELAPRLEEAVPRLVLANAALESAGQQRTSRTSLGRTLCTLEADAAGELCARAPHELLELSVPGHVRALLRAGDLARGQRRAGKLAPDALYPALARPLFTSRASSA